MNRKKPEPSGRHGPEPLRLKIEGDLGDAFARIVNAGKPAAPKKSKRLKKK